MEKYGQKWKESLATLPKHSLVKLLQESMDGSHARGFRDGVMEAQKNLQSKVDGLKGKNRALNKMLNVGESREQDGAYELNKLQAEIENLREENEVKKYEIEMLEKGFNDATEEAESLTGVIEGIRRALEKVNNIIAELKQGFFDDAKIAYYQDKAEALSKAKEAKK